MMLAVGGLRCFVARSVVRRHCFSSLGTAVYDLPVASYHQPSTTSAISCPLFRLNHCHSQRGAPVMLKQEFHATNFNTNEASRLGTNGTHDDIPNKPAEDVNKKLSQRQKLKHAVKEYGATVIVFHTCISLCTLGLSYAAVSSGLDVVGLMAKLGVGQSMLDSKLATGASTFVIAYAVHKVFAPARMATTAVAAPLIVRYLRRVGFLKHSVTKS